MSKFVFVQKKKLTPIRRRIDDAAAASWTNALDNFGERPLKRQWNPDPEGSPAIDGSPPSPSFEEAKRARRLVLCERNSRTDQRRPRAAPDQSGSPTFAGQEPGIVDCEDSPQSHSPVFGPRWDISPGSPTSEQPGRPSSPVISSFGSSASSASARLVCVTPERTARPPPLRTRAPDSGRKTQRKFVRGGLAERTARLRQRWRSEAAIWLHGVREKGSQDSDPLLLRIHSCSCSFSLLALSCSVLAGPPLFPRRGLRVLFSQALPELDPRDFPSGAALRVFSPWELSRSEAGALLWNVTHYLVER